MTPASATAAALARLAEMRDPAAWSWLVETHGFTLYRSCLAVLGDRDLAEDAVQEVFLHLRQTVDRFRPRPEAPEVQAIGWLKRVACTVALQLARSQARRQRREQEQARTAPQEASDPEIRTDDDLARAVREHLAGMPDRDRLPLVLHYYGDLGYEDLARELRCTVNAARVRVHRSLERLRRSLKKCGIAVVPAALVANLEAVQPVAASIAQFHSSEAVLAGLKPLLASSQVPVLGHAALATIGGITMPTKIGIALSTLITGGLITYGVATSPGEEAPVPAGTGTTKIVAKPQYIPLTLEERERFQKELTSIEGQMKTLTTAQDTALAKGQKFADELFEKYGTMDASERERMSKTLDALEQKSKEDSAVYRQEWSRLAVRRHQLQDLLAYGRPIPPPADDWRKSLRLKLAQQVTLHFDEQSIDDVVRFLIRHTDINFVMDPRIDPRQHPPCTLQIDTITLHHALEFIMLQTGLCYELRSEGIFITKKAGEDGPTVQKPPVPDRAGLEGK